MTPPIHEDQRGRYPSNWKQLSARIRFGRAEGRCECDGRCGAEHGDEMREGRCTREHGELIPKNAKGSLVVLTTAHLDHDPGNCDESNLLALCQRCHLNYDREHHASERARRRAAKEEIR
mgnify:CR=1 FL=1